MGAHSIGDIENVFSRNLVSVGKQFKSFLLCFFFHCMKSYFKTTKCVHNIYFMELLLSTQAPY